MYDLFFSTVCDICFFSLFAWTENVIQLFFSEDKFGKQMFYSMNFSVWQNWKVEGHNHD